ncbi:MAG: hypothetical protein JNK53_03710 [Phycisphaerae bacterium]|nr:hypothetical protein [Phycisphaerae bacterium]
MSCDELRAHAAAGRITGESFIQQIGKDNWVVAAKVPGLWVTPTTDAGADPAGSQAGADASSDSAAGGPDGAPAEGGHHGHHARLAESMQHLLQRALLGTVTISAPECEQPVRALLAGVTVDSIALEFEAGGTVVLIPWSRLRSISLPAEHARTTARIRTKAEVLIIEVEHLPLSVVQSAQAV